jgi:hypothetical protein
VIETFARLKPDGLRLRSLRRRIDERLLRAVAFVARCSGAATCAYFVADWLGLPHPLWATISALMVPQEKLADTNDSLWGYIFGTLVGVVGGGMASVAASRLAIDMAGQIALSVGLCAILARAWPSTRVCMWTGPIVLLTAESALPVTHAALYRGSEALLGAFVGAAFHWAAEIVVLPIAHRTALKLGTVLGKTETSKGGDVSLCYGFAERMKAMLGYTGINVLVRLTGVHPALHRHPDHPEQAKAHSPARVARTQRGRP